MDINKILSSDYLDIVFDGRNKGYGGYALRKSYPQRVRNAMLFLGVGLSMFIAYSTFAGRGKHIEQDMAKSGVVDLAPPPEPTDVPSPPLPPPPPPPPPAPPIHVDGFTPPVIVDDDLVAPEDQPPAVADITNVGLHTVDGDISDLNPNLVDGPRGRGSSVVSVTPIEPPAIPKYVEQMPEPGYNVNEYLKKHLVYPMAAMETGIQGRVSVQFIVSEDGSISAAKIVGNKSYGGGLEQEALRVVSSMPKWKPGKQNGKAVKVYYTLPIHFVLN